MKKLLSLILVLTMALSLCACGKADDYESAIALMEAGNYEEAIVAFTELGDYKDSVQKLEECENALSYAEAVALFEAEQYEEALAIFTALGNYQDSIAKTKECENAIAYNEALTLIDNELYFEAYDIFSTIATYKNVPEYLNRYQTIEISIDNWFEFFEITEEYKYNAFDEIEGYITSLQLKDGYVMNEATTDIDIEYSYEEYWKYFKLDNETGDVVLGDIAYEHIIGTSTASFAIPKLNMTTAFGIIEDKIIHGTYDILRIQGSLSIYVK